MIKGYSKRGMTRLSIGTHLGDFSPEVSKQYVEALKFAMKSGLSVDGAINYRGMCSEKDQGLAIRQVIEEGSLSREEIFVSSKAGLLFGDITEGLNPGRYLEEKLVPQGISLDDFVNYEGLLQTLNPAFYELALNKSLENLGLETIDLHYMHIPKISRLKLSEAEFYDRLELLFKWYEDKVSQGKLRSYGIALEFMAQETEEEKWHFEMEELVARARRVAGDSCHLKYVIFECNPMCTAGVELLSQTVKGEEAYPGSGLQGSGP